MMKKIFFCAAAVLFLAARYAGGAEMKIGSPSFGQGGMIPDKFTCKGQEISPELSIEGVPAGCQSLVLIVDDPDAPMGTFVHWVAFNIPPATTAIPENGTPGVQAKNSGRGQGYTGPCPPSGTHRYYFKLYALDSSLSLGAGADKAAVEKAIKGHVLAQAELMGRYSK
jgi:Raf kinase inhibitor-like YbhB/YbcL family protein